MLLEYLLLKRRMLKRRRWWVRPVNRMRDAQGFYFNLFKELVETDHEEFFGLFRMSPNQFHILVELLHPHLKKRSIRTPLPTDLRVSVTLLYLAQGDTTRLKHAEFRIGTSTVYKIIHETCTAIWDVLQPLVLKTPSKEDWKTISDGFMTWQFPNCVGAIDGRHMRIQAPVNSGSNYYNYKQFFSMVMMATCDAKYKFTWVDVGQFGSISDGGVWANTKFANDLSSGNVSLPDPSPLPGEEIPFPYMFVGDEAFPLTNYIMRPYSRKTLTDENRIFNYRLSRARRVIENIFGILTARWKIL
ncbi:protein ALP1-like [Camponotus floridanus]|uniref:protein ALP1-like n=1 Tax=Camponotus floridanus TaxID=104421 RepID=UPI000DC6AA93|nr:protein ALP1-like [Camponotus floridanus]